ncbi:MAG: hypothetical protein AAF809_06490 [Bacteroidota bacterium]
MMTDTALHNLGRFLAPEIDPVLTCGECAAYAERYAELAERGQDAGAVLPLVQEHLDHCPECMEEFQALIDALEANTA